ncbi:MAG: hypothetical protein Kow0047_25610 [Anaerolineae bacterium]
MDGKGPWVDLPFWVNELDIGEGSLVRQAAAHNSDLAQPVTEVRAQAGRLDVDDGEHQLVNWREQSYRLTHRIYSHPSRRRHPV